MEVGREFKIREIVTVTGTGYPESYTSEIYWYKVEDIETIRVQAGQFRCLKIAKYEQDEITEIGAGWVSDEVKLLPVKMEGSDPMWGSGELVSYSFA